MTSIKDRIAPVAASLYAKPFTLEEAQAALREPVSEDLRAHILPLIDDLRFVLTCAKERQAAMCQTLLFTYEVSQKQLDQSIVLLDAVASVIDAIAKEE